VRDGSVRHVAMIMDGNGRWAKRRGLSRWEGHVAGAHAVERLVRFLAEHAHVDHLTLFAFSCENWTRPQQEVDALMALLQQFASERLPELRDAGIRLRVIGDLAALPDGTRQAVETAVEQTAKGEALHLTLALNYGSRQEIARACRRIAQRVNSGEIALEAVDESLVEAHLDTRALPDPDLIIRTSGELRLSNFLLWQSAYSELAFSETMWPDFTPEEFLEILEEYRGRERRFGTVVEGA
jgi:undecaprenyl diphosphate synthase